MQASTRAFIKRGGAACAAAAVLLGGSFTAATAAPSNDLAPSPAVSVEATSPTNSDAPPASSSAAPLPEGLAEAVDRDLNLSVEEFNAQGELAAKAAEIQTEVTKADPAGVVSIAGDTIKVQTSPTASAAAKTAAGGSKVVITTASAAPATAPGNATSLDSLIAAYASEFGVANLQSIMVNGNGEFVIRTGDPLSAGPALNARSFTATVQPLVADFAAKFTNVTVEAASGPATPLATDVVNGQGYLAVDSTFTNGGSCSIGWNGFNRDGNPAIVTAGHCTQDGALTDTYLTDPQQEPAVTEDLNSGGILGPLGTFGASQFGGPGNTPGAPGPNWDGTANTASNIGTDVAVIDGINPEVNLLAKVTDWTTPADPQAAGPVVAGVSEAVLGTSICKSGRTTGWSCGTVSEVGAFFVGGYKMATDPDDIRVVRGFGSTSLQASQGDSGGAIIAGNMAVGMISAGTTDGTKTYGVSLMDALKHTDGYSVKIFLEKPVVTTTGTVYREGTISGTVTGTPAGTTVTVIIDGVTTEVPVVGGTWTAKAPNKFGTFPVTAQAKNGFSTSETAEASVEVIKETLAVPVITAPANTGTVAAPVTVITGTGKAGATVELSGDATGTAVVGKDGKWSVTIDEVLEIGKYAVTAKQTLKDWNDSKEATSTFDVVLAAPAILSPANGHEFAFDQGPVEITGTNVEDATVTVAVDGATYEATVVDGTWSVTLDARLATGEYTVTAVQTVGDDKSLTSTWKFSVLAEPKPEPSEAPSVTEKPKPEPSEAPSKAPSSNDLANTGTSSSVLVLGGAGGLLLLAGSVFLLIRRRNTAA